MPKFSTKQEAINYIDFNTQIYKQQREQRLQDIRNKKAYYLILGFFLPFLFVLSYWLYLVVCS